MIIGKDKLKLKELQEENEKLKREIQMQAINTNKDLLNIVKVVLYHCTDNELTISKYDIEKAEKGLIYATDDIIRDTKRIKLIFKKNCLNEHEYEV